MLTRSGIERMRASAPIKVGAAVLPSLTTACRKRGLSTEGGATKMKKRLREDRSDEMLRCPVCFDVPPAEDVVVVCSEGHHTCFRCLSQLRKPSCPLCTNPLCPSPPGYLLRQLLEYEYRSPAHPKENMVWMALYRQVHPFLAGENKDVWSLTTIRSFGLAIQTAEGRRWVAQFARWRSMGEAAERQMSEAMVKVRQIIRRCELLPSSSSSSSSSSEEDE